MKYWKIAPGDKGFLWVEQRDNDCIAVGWNDVGNLKNFKNNEEIKKKFKEEYPNRRHKQLISFFNDVLIGDKIVASSGRHIFGIGTITGSYRYNDELYYCHSKPVQWGITFWDPIDIYDDIRLSGTLREKLNRQATVKELTKSEWEIIENELSRIKTPFKNMTNWEGLPRAPDTEQEVIILFSKLIQCLKMKIERVSTRFPDALLQVKQNGKWISKSAEFELYSSGFDHFDRLKETKCDMIICWEDDWKNKPIDIEIIELRKVLLEII
ncbi:MAG: hypothetical protein JW840_10680 [Candidatus Thermoplasmatota archaeon]|nr:hypothetical protein [Candidatus Thermoplasmatota archaeon]